MMGYLLIDKGRASFIPETLISLIFMVDVPIFFLPKKKPFPVYVLENSLVVY